MRSHPSTGAPTGLLRKILTRLVIIVALSPIVIPFLSRRFGALSGTLPHPASLSADGAGLFSLFPSLGTLVENLRAWLQETLNSLASLPWELFPPLAALLFLLLVSREKNRDANRQSLPASAPLFPIICPPARENLSRPSAQGAWGPGLSPILFAAPRKLLLDPLGEAYRSEDIVDFKTGLPRPDSVALGKANQTQTREMERVFGEQLGRRFDGDLLSLSLPEKALATALFAFANDEKERALELFSLLESGPNSPALAAQETNLNDALAWWRYFQPEELARHQSFVNVFFIALGKLALANGPLPSAALLWLKPHSRALYYALRRNEEKAVWSEAAGAYAHYLSEEREGSSLTEPSVSGALASFTEALKAENWLPGTLQGPFAIAVELESPPLPPEARFIPSNAALPFTPTKAPNAPVSPERKRNTPLGVQGFLQGVKPMTGLSFPPQSPPPPLNPLNSSDSSRSGDAAGAADSNRASAPAASPAKGAGAKPQTVLEREKSPNRALKSLSGPPLSFPSRKPSAIAPIPVETLPAQSAAISPLSLAAASGNSPSVADSPKAAITPLNSKPLASEASLKAPQKSPLPANAITSSPIGELPQRELSPQATPPKSLSASFKSETILKKPLEATTSPKESSKTATPKKEPDKAPTPKKGPDEAATSHKKPSKAKASQKLPEKAPASQKDPSKTPTPKKETSKTLTPQKETSKTPASQKDPSKTSTPKKEPSKTAASQKKPSKTPTPNNEPSKVAISHKEPSKTPTPKKETGKTLTPKKEPSKTPASQKKPSKTPTPKKEPGEAGKPIKTALHKGAIKKATPKKGILKKKAPQRSKPWRKSKKT
ncbi:MAG: hypothetical protein LBO66_08170 [Deltaproteobacteria bacterium]|jgi:hypothetical protein|nr:hypothetical protein [Deltaproteobacteria bacterium]